MIPVKSLQNYVKRFWKIRNLTSNEQLFTVLPDGYFDLVVTILNNKVINISLTGLYTKEFDVKVHANAIYLGISFYPIAVEYILEEKIADIVNQHRNLPLSFLSINEIKNINDLKIYAEILSLNFILRLEKHKNIDERREKLFTVLGQYKGVSSVSEISNELFWNSRQINRYFNKYFGISLKSYCNILKCKSSFIDIKKGILSPTLNYTDQAHFIKEVRKHTGTTPKILSKNKNDRFVQFSTKIL